MQKVANQVAVAVDNTLNFESAQAAQQQLTRERDRLQLLLEVNNAVTAHLDLRKVFAAISAKLGRVINLDAAAMTLYDQESGQLRAFALEPQLPFVKKPIIEEGTLFPMEGTPGEQAITSRQTVLVTRANIENSSSPVVQKFAADGVKAGCVAPLISHGRVLGTLDVVSMREGAFTKQDAELLTQIAGQIAIAVENALNFQDASISSTAVGARPRPLEPAAEHHQHHSLAPRFARTDTHHIFQRARQIKSRPYGPVYLRRGTQSVAHIHVRLP